jgi:hypothetical protein
MRRRRLPTRAPALQAAQAQERLPASPYGGGGDWGTGAWSSGGGGGRQRSSHEGRAQSPTVSGGGRGADGEGWPGGRIHPTLESGLCFLGVRGSWGRDSLRWWENWGHWVDRSPVPELDSLAEGMGCTSWSESVHGRASALCCPICHYPFPQELLVASPFPLLSENGRGGRVAEDESPAGAEKPTLNQAGKGRPPRVISCAG